LERGELKKATTQEKREHVAGGLRSLGRILGLYEKILLFAKAERKKVWKKPGKKAKGEKKMTRREEVRH